MDKSKQIAKILLEIKAVTLNVKEPYKYSSGIVSPIYCDNRLLLSYPKQRQKVRDAFIELIRSNKLNFDIVGGTATAGIPHAAWLADALKKPMIYIRSKSKGYGKNKLIEGNLDKGQKVLIIEDLVSTGGSCIEAVRAARLEGGIVKDCLAIFTYQLTKSELNFKKANVNLYSLTNLNILLDTAVYENYITVKEKKSVLEWACDPEHWYDSFRPQKNRAK
ncbi:MAG: orotate phosphoribosyltransferase [Candidatus Jacksonbacteria bacterium]